MTGLPLFLEPRGGLSWSGEARAVTFGAAAVINIVAVVWAWRAIGRTRRGLDPDRPRFLPDSPGIWRMVGGGFHLSVIAMSFVIWGELVMWGLPDDSLGFGLESVCFLGLIATVGVMVRLCVTGRPQWLLHPRWRGGPLIDGYSTEHYQAPPKD